MGLNRRLGGGYPSGCRGGDVVGVPLHHRRLAPPRNAVAPVSMPAFQPCVPGTAFALIDPNRALPAIAPATPAAPRKGLCPFEMVDALHRSRRHRQSRMCFRFRTEYRNFTGRNGIAATVYPVVTAEQKLMRHADRVNTLARLRNRNRLRGIDTSDSSTRISGSMATVRSAAVAGSVGTAASAGVAGSVATVASAGVAGAFATAGSAAVAGSALTLGSFAISGCLACIGCFACRRCVGCVGCAVCTDCVGCVGCFNCSGLRNAVGVRDVHA
jgi:hypothetical protein